MKTKYITKYKKRLYKPLPTFCEDCGTKLNPKKKRCRICSSLNPFYKVEPKTNIDTDLTDKEMEEIEEAYENIQKEKHIAEYKSTLLEKVRKMIRGKKYRKVTVGYKQKGESGYATNSSYCEGANGVLGELLDQIESIIGEKYDY